MHVKYVRIAIKNENCGYSNKNLMGYSDCISPDITSITICISGLTGH